MEGYLPHRLAFPSRILVGFVGLAVVIASGCSNLFSTQKVLSRGEQGTVALEEIVDWSFEASHPAHLDSALLARMLEGVRTGSHDDGPAYPQKEIEYLAPLLAHALSKARREDIVVFHLTQTAGASGITGGTLYVKGPSVYLTPLSTRSSTVSAFSFGRSKGLLASGTPQNIDFEPRSIATIQSAPTDVALGQGHLKSLVIDHVALASLPAETPLRKPAPPSSSVTTSTAGTASPSPARAVTPTVNAPAAHIDRPTPDASTRAVTVQPASAPVAPKAAPPIKPNALSGKKSSKKAPAPKASSKRSTAGKTTKAPAKPSPKAMSEHKAILEILKHESSAPPLSPK